MDLDMIADRLLPDGALEWSVAAFVWLVFFAFFAVMLTAASSPLSVALLVPAAIATSVVTAMLWLSR